jgi:membrane protease YdiL (CAAX protease family)
MSQNDKIKRNVVIYVVVVLFLATFGSVVSATVNEAGGLIFITSPILMMVLLRFFSGDGWKDAGLGLNLKESWRWYLFSLLAYPITITMVIALGVMFGMITINGDLNTLLPLFIAGVAAQLIPRMLFALFEEWGWRGYLEPRLTMLGVPDLRRHLLVGVIWAIWHFPLILSTDYTESHYAIFPPLFIIGVMLTAIVYGQLRKASKTVWTSVLMHGVSNTMLWAIIQDDLMTFNNRLLASPAPESILMILLWGALGWWMLHRLKA